MQAAALDAVTAIEPHSLPILYAHAEGRADTPEGAAEVARHAQRWPVRWPGWMRISRRMTS